MCKTNSNPEIIKTINEGIETARGYGLKLTVENSEQLDAVKAEDILKNAFFNKPLKDYALTAVETVGGYGAIVAVILNDKIIYKDLQLYYNAWKPETAEAVAYMLGKAEKSVFTVAEILDDPIKSYAEFRNKKDFVVNLYPKIFGYVSSIYIGKPSEEQKQAAEKMYLCRVNWAYFANKEHVEKVEKLYDGLKEKHLKQLAEDMNYFKTAVKSEMYNYECYYGWRYEEALAEIGLTFDGLTPEQCSAYNAAKKEYIDERNKGDY